MPLYEYECTDCRNRFEVRQRVSDEPITVCPSCGGVTKRVLFPPGIVFKGSGWYITDSRKSDTASAPSTSDSGNSDGKKETSPTKTTSAGSSSDSGSKSTASTTPT